MTKSVCPLTAEGVTPVPTTTYNYTYGNTAWGDQLTSFGNGSTIYYDAVGNPTNYSNGEFYSPILTWENGRQLTYIMRPDTSSIKYQYNDEGVRVYKYISGVETYYFVEGTRIIYELSDGNSTFYLYDESGSPIGIKHISSETQEGYYSTYYFDKNLQGDIVGIYDEWGTKLAEYTYDAWGNFTATYMSYGENSEIIQNNPFLYRGYYYDYETGFYYLNSRYYDPVTGRFINADGQLSLGGDLLGANLYAYCGNNPVMRVDPNGEAWWHWAIGAAVVAACAVATVVTCGGFAAAAGAVSLVACGTAAATTASTVAASAFIGSSVALATSAMVVASQSSSVEEFMDGGNWGTVAGTVIGGVAGGFNGFAMAQNQIPHTNTSYNLNGAKDSRYISNRGWNDEMINNSIRNGRQGTSINMANGAPCTVYSYPGINNQYVVIENESRTVVQVSNFHDSGWIPDSRIVWDP